MAEAGGDVDKGAFFPQTEVCGYGEDCAEGFCEEYGKCEEGRNGKAAEEGFEFGNAGARGGIEGFALGWYCICGVGF